MGGRNENFFNHMAHVRRPRDPMDRPRKPDVVQCRRHPKHRQSPGVCSLCLREKLSRLSNSGGRIGSFSSWIMAVSFNNDDDDDSSCSSSSSLSPYSSSSSASSPSSPVHRYRFGKEPGHRLGGNKNVLVKSQPIAFISRRRGKEGGDHKDGNIGGFWSKLIPGRERRTGSSRERRNSSI